MAFAHLKTNTTDPSRAPYKVVWKLPGAKGQNSRSFTRKDVAKAFLREREEEVEGRSTPRDEEAGRITLREHAAEVMPNWVDLRAGSLTRYAASVEGQILPFLGDLPLDAIDVDVLRAWVPEIRRRGNARTGGPLAAATVHKAINALSRLLDDAVPKRLAANPLADRKALRIPRVEDSGRESLTLAEVEHLADELPDEYRALAWVGATAGLRIGELLALRWRDVDVERGTVRVVRSVTESSGILHAQSYGKTGNAFRTIPIPGRTARALAELHEWTPHASSTSPVFAASRGGIYRPGLFRSRVFLPAAKRAGLVDEAGAPVTPHVLRHTCATWWMEEGTSPMLVARWMGHSASDGGAFVVRRYGHVSPTHGGEVVARMDARLDGTTAGVVDLGSRRAG